ncbi:hypothetical protein GCM10009804_49880 [Kribbella hippodromi]|uniref:Uncharacterized protein n=1 Tax=Kribbella hippodromi TaxID=434347 RepID=A0ABN2DXP7_9ACTN
MPATTVRITQSPDGTITVLPDYPASTTDFTRAVLDVAGAVLTWPILDGATLPTAHIHDPVRAQQWLWALYNEQVATAVDDVATAVVVEQSALGRTAGQLAFAHWAARWWPVSYLDGIPDLNPAVLALETAALTHRCQQLFDDQDDQPDNCAADLIGEHQSTLIPLLHWLHTPSITPVVAQQLTDVLQLIDDAADSSGLDSPALRTLRAALSQEPSPTTAPAELFAPQNGYALAAGDQHAATGRLIARGNGTNDWRRYPPGFVDASEDAISWTVRAQGARRQLDIEVVAHPSAPTGAPLAADVHVRDRSAPGTRSSSEARMLLTRRDDSWTGSAELPVPLTSAPEEQLLIGVEVLLPGFDPGAGPDARADRTAVRALARQRMLHATSTTEPAIQPLLAEVLAGVSDGGDY